MIKVAKFGGSSVADASQFRKVKAIIEKDETRKIVVVSASGRRFKDDNKITDLLYLCQAHIKYSVSYDSIFHLIEERFQSIKNDLHLCYDLNKEFKIIRSIMIKNTSIDAIVSRGEYLTACLMSEYLGYAFADAKDLIHFHYDGKLDHEKTKQAFDEIMRVHDKIVVPGFYGSLPNGEIHIMSRGGSDITGAILADLCDADVYENWTDVSGFLMADPRIVKDPEQITHITYSELRELSYMGASVLHEEAIFPVKEANIPIHILNTNRPQDAGTIIQEHNNYVNPYAITGIAGKTDFLSIYIYKKHMSNEIGFIRKVLSILEAYHISVEHIPSGIDSFSIVVSKKDIEDSLYEILARIKTELKPDEIKTQEDISLISTVGKNMSDKPGTSGKLFGSLGANNINIVMIAQGSDEINITVGVKKKDFEKTIQVIYDTFVTKEKQS